MLAYLETRRDSLPSLVAQDRAGQAGALLRPLQLTAIPTCCRNTALSWSCSGERFCRCILPSVNCSSGVQRLEAQLPTSQGRCDLCTKAASPLCASGTVGSHEENTPSRSQHCRVSLQLRGQGIQLGCGKSTFSSLLT